MSVRKRTWTTNGVERSAWQADYVDAQGKRRRKNFKLKKDADKFLAVATVEVGQGVHVPDSETVTVSEAGKAWLAACAAADLEPTTIAQYKQHLMLHIEPLIGGTKLSKVTVPAVRAFQDQLREKGRSPAMVKRVTVSLGSILSNAQEQGFAAVNAVHQMKSRRKAARSSEKRQNARLRVGVDIPTVEEIRAILKALDGRYKPLLMTAIFTGLRASELRGLSWPDVDLDKAVLHVRQRADAHNQIGPPKSEAGYRTIPLPPMVVDTLKAWREECPKGELDLVFPNGEGKVEWHANLIKRGLHPALIAAGVTSERSEVSKGPDVGTLQPVPKYSGMHALRHWFASWCINPKDLGGLGLLPKAVQARMGHGSIQVTFDTYGHLFPATDEKAAMEAAQAALFGTQMAQIDGEIPETGA